jgi:uncharacterized protein (TIGR04255 family)
MPLLYPKNPDHHDLLPSDIWKIRPAVEAVIELRFPDILAIMAKPPVEYQDCIIQKYPIFSLTKELLKNSLHQAYNAPQTDSPAGDLARKYFFSAKDDLWFINLTCSSLAVGTKKFTSLEDFLDRLQAPMNALQKIYHPPFFERLSFRVMDNFCQPNLGLQPLPWSDLLSPWILGILANENLAPQIKNHFSANLMDIGGNSMAAVISATGLPGLNDDQAPELTFTVDWELYNNSRLSTDDVIDLVKDFYEYSNSLFFSIITEKLHNNLILNTL